MSISTCHIQVTLYPLLLFPMWLFISLTTTVISPVARIPSSWTLHYRNVSSSGFPECVVYTEKRFTSLLPTTNFTISTRSLCLSRLATLVYPFFCNACTYIIKFLLNSHPKQFGIVFSTKESTSFIFLSYVLYICCIDLFISQNLHKLAYSSVSESHTRYQTWMPSLLTVYPCHRVHNTVPTHSVVLHSGWAFHLLLHRHVGVSTSWYAALLFTVVIFLDLIGAKVAC